MLDVLHDVPLASRTTLGLGGPARHLVEVEDEPSLGEALRWAASRGLPVLVLGGGSNLVVRDGGWDGLVVQMGLRGVELQRSTGRLWVAAGEPWDAVVAQTVHEGWSGLECLSGIPGSAGATPIQNVGAYGQEVAEVIAAVHVWDRRTSTRRVLPPSACGFGYRQSTFKRDPDAAVVLGVDFQLRPGGPPTLRYAELQRGFGGSGAALPSLLEVRERVLELRRGKSMVIEAGDPNRRSAGSFFTNPVVDGPVAEALVEQALREGVVERGEAVPRHGVEGGRVKIPAAWLIEAAGFRKGERRGAVGISSRHALALVHHGGGSTRELMALAEEMVARVQERFGIELRPEPVLVGVG